jgi:D-methionine transport system ATP-binding protein
VITTTELRKVYRSGGRETVALDGVDLHVREGEVYGVVGTSGAGKSTLIRAVNLLERPTSGTVTVDGRELTALPPGGRKLREARRSIGMVFQHFNLLANRTVRENVELPLEIIGLDRRDRRRRAEELLDLVGLDAKGAAYPAQLSGGQKQRVGIARALAGDPKVLLSDEATSALDPETTRSVLRLLRDLNRQLGLTVLLITHEMEVIRTVCDSAALMSGGRIAESGRLDDLLASPGSALARELFPLGEADGADGSGPGAGAGAGADGTVVEITFQGDSSAQPFISQLARTYHVDINILGAAVETIGGRQVGRMRVRLPGGYQDNVVPLGYLRERGLQVDVVAPGDGSGAGENRGSAA